MKEVTGENWKKNPTPRFMWCWDGDGSSRCKEYVVCILTKEESQERDTLPVITPCANYQHCAEIEEEKTQLTYYELSQLVKCFGVELCYVGGESYSHFAYTASAANKKLPGEYKIRYKQGEWEEPTRETFLKWWKDTPCGSDIDKFFTFIGWGE